MKILNFGSLNLDMVYAVPHFVRGGETISSLSFQKNVGGKGLNQSVALKRGGADVFHAGLIGADGIILKEFLDSYGVNTRYVRTIDVPSGHAVIQVEPEGDNCIFLYGGANQCVTEEFIEEALAGFEAGDLLILQNEINGIEAIIRAASERGMQVALNPSPADEKIDALPLDRVSWFILNETEGAYLSGVAEPEAMLDSLLKKYPNAKFVLTLGGNGSIYADGKRRVRQRAYRAEAVDTTGAGDTFTGFFFAAISNGASIGEALNRASMAAAISVTRPGAAASIPELSEVLNRL